MSFSGRATDEHDRALAGSRLRWSLILRHCRSDGSCHTHPRQEEDRGSSGSFVAPDPEEHGRPSYLELRLTATDSRGLTDSVRLDP